jgi:hypothetical protein
VRRLGLLRPFDRGLLNNYSIKDYMMQDLLQWINVVEVLLLVYIAMNIK